MPKLRLELVLCINPSYKDTSKQNWLTNIIIQVYCIILFYLFEFLEKHI